MAALTTGVPRTARVCIHDLFTEIVRSQPTAPAVCAWDGSLTYEELDRLSTLLAHRLVALNVGCETIIPICVGKSMWTSVAVLGIIKAGAASLNLDVNEPEQRLAELLKDVKPVLILSSAAQQELGSRLGNCPVLTLGLETLEHPMALETALPEVDADALLYVNFTSGSTGSRKGAMVTHANYASALLHGRARLSVHKDSRMLDTASPSFDAACQGVMLDTLTAGACLCIPSDTERLSDFAGAIHRYRATIASVTPTLARLLSPAECTTLRTLRLGGESVGKSDLAAWNPYVDVVLLYGPCECSAQSAVGNIGRNEELPLTHPWIGPPTGCVAWIIDEQSNKPVIDGETGELYIEGPIVGRGYLGDDQRTAASFLENPPWLLESAGRQGRVYRTGDLVRSVQGGSLVFCGRKDNQVKVHGQRIELGEVEFHVRKELVEILYGTPSKQSKVQVVAEIIRLPDPSETLLVVFIHFTDIVFCGNIRDEFVQKMTSSGLVDRLSSQMPSWMIPMAFIPLEGPPPKTATGKTDRRALRDIGSALSRSDLRKLSLSGVAWRAPSSDLEKELVNLWAEVLEIEADSIGADESFLRLGDSLQAMKLVGVARRRGILFTVPDVLRHPRLSDLAMRMTKQAPVAEEVPKFSLLKSAFDLESVRQEIGRDYDIEDVLPCTPLQEGLLALTAQTGGDYVACMVRELPRDLELGRFVAAWNTVNAAVPILRTRVFDLSEHGLVQVVLSQPEPWTFGSDLDAHRAALSPMGLGDSLSRYAIIDEGHGSGKRFFVWTIHHALYDGISLPLILEALEDAYKGADASQLKKRLTPFQNFVKLVVDVDSAEAEEFWEEKQFAGIEAPLFPSLPPGHTPRTDRSMTRELTGLDELSNFTVSTVIRASWVLCLAQSQGVSEALFGSVVAGRFAHPGMESVVGPTLATVPVRVVVPEVRHTTVESFLQQVHDQAISMMPYEQTGLQRIQKMSADARHACNFQTLLIVQPGAAEDSEGGAGNKSSIFSTAMKNGSMETLEGFSTYALVIECFTRSKGVSFKVTYDSHVLREDQVTWLLSRFENVFAQIAAPGSSELALDQIRTISSEELAQIHKWNADLPPKSETQCVHDAIAITAARQPNAPAICSWDGDFTYAELDRISTRLAITLIWAGIGVGDIVPLCFEKTRWMPVAMLAVMKAGGASLALDTTQPPERLEALIRQVQPKLVLSSICRQLLAEQVASCSIVTLDDQFLLSTPYDGGPFPKLVEVSPSSLLYLVFTSGSTGTPKGVMITHENFGSAVQSQQQILDFTGQSRVFDFASPAFDVAWSNFLHTMVVGGCLCIPSDADRLQNLPDAIDKLKANYIEITPSAATLLDGCSLPTLRTLNLSGEKVKPAKIPQIGSDPRILNTYGPAECTITCSAAEIQRDAPSQADLGKLAGAIAWIVDVRDNTHLSPIGAPGELWLEGPIVGPGYFKDAVKTEATFITSPPWLESAGLGLSQNRGRFYRTGDIVRYTGLNGELEFIGRADDQVKIRGQRVDPGEVESHLSEIAELASLPYQIQVVCSVVTFRETGTPVLVAFIHLSGTEEHEYYNETVRKVSAVLQARLSERLPAFMHPHYIPVPEIPLTPSGKIDKRRLCKSASAMNWDYVRRHSASESKTAFSPPESSQELKLRSLWADVLGKDPELIGATDSFFNIGGDSIQAMRLAAAARRVHIELRVADVLQSPRLCDLAATMKTVSQPVVDGPDALFSLLRSGAVDIQDIRQEVALACNAEGEQVEDVFPCTPLQEGLLALTSYRTGDYVACVVRELHSSVDISRMVSAWDHIVDSIPILRTRIVDLSSEGLCQAILQQKGDWHFGDDLEAYVKHSKRQDMGLGCALSKHALIKDAKREVTFFVWTVHHALYDGWSMDLILNALEQAYDDGEQPLQIAPYQAFVKQIIDQDYASMSAFWTRQFDGLAAPAFPSWPSLSRRPHVDKTWTHEIEDLDWNNGDYTASSKIRAAWSVLTAKHCDATESLFGSLVSGRQAAIPGVDDNDQIAGPTIATVPIRIGLDWEENTIDTLLRQVQTQAVEMIHFEQTGLQQIRKLGDEARQACDFQTLLVVHPVDSAASDEENKGLFIARDNTSDPLSDSGDIGDFHTYALTVRCQLTRRGMQLKLLFDSTALSPQVAERLAYQFEHVLKQFCEEEFSQRRLRDIEVLSNEDASLIWRQNAHVPSTKEDCVHDLVSAAVSRQPSAPAICAWDGNLTYIELELFSTQLAYMLIREGAGQEGVHQKPTIPLCFEKSVWMPVAMLAVMKAGGTFVPLDPKQPEGRLRAIVQQVQPRMILSSSNNQALARRLGSEKVFTVEHDSVCRKTTTTRSQLPAVSPHDILYLIFTSGSTGTPKGVMISHANFSSGMFHQKAGLGFEPPGLRVLDFSSYAFDVSLSNVLHAFTSGGCLCIPSQKDIEENLEGAIHDLGVTYAALNPSVARLIEPRKVGDLRSIRFIGESADETDIAAWNPFVNVVIGYGPSECTVTATYRANVTKEGPHPCIGKAGGCLSWVVDPTNDQQLAAAGAVGELWIEGPIVGCGYLDDPEKTAAGFVEDPPWLLRGAPDCPGRKGRLYRTGDLVRYTADQDGSLLFVGRKDAQVKIRGQRIELGEVEHHIRQGLLDVIAEDGPSQEDRNPLAGIEVAVEVITPQGSEYPALAVFLAPRTAKEESHNSTDAENQNRRASSIGQASAKINAQVSVRLPSYMVPTAWLPLPQIPVTSSGKTDRKELRRIGGSRSWTDISSIASSYMRYEPPRSRIEAKVQSLCAKVLRIDRSVISMGDNFLSIGGDSIQAMRLVSAARQVGLSLTVADIFKFPRLADLATAVTEIGKQPEEEIAPFSLLNSSLDDRTIRSEVAVFCDVGEEKIEDVFPCTPLQEGLLAMTARLRGNYTACIVRQLQPNIDAGQFVRSWNKTAMRLPILRTRIVDVPHTGLLQVILNDHTPWEFGEGLDTFLKTNSERTFGLGEPLSRQALIRAQGKTFFVWTIHHALYDAWCMRLILDASKRAYFGLPGKPSTPFQAYLKYISDQDHEAQAKYWAREFTGLQAPAFPALPSPAYTPVVERSHKHIIQELNWHGNGFTISTLIRSAWALLMTRYCNTDEALFGVTVSGRQAPVPSVETIAAPTIATVPLRVSISKEATIQDLLQNVQYQGVSMIPFEQTGLQQIRQYSPEAEQACRFQTLLVVDVAEDSNDDHDRKDSLFATEVDLDADDSFNSYALTIACRPADGNLQVELDYDPRILDENRIKRLAAQFEHVLLQLCQGDGQQLVRNLDATSRDDLRQIWEWNSEVPNTIDRCVHDLIKETVLRQPDSMAVSAWDGELTYGELDEKSTKLAYHLAKLGVGPEVKVPLYFEKSLWMPITMLAVMKAGGASVCLGCNQPEERLRAIIQQIEPNMILCSASQKDSARRIVESALPVVCPSEMQNSETPTDIRLRQADPSNLLFIVFTSGSTGEPKGVLTSHANFSSAVVHQNCFEMTRDSRVLCFASYGEFDVCWSNFIHNAVAGGCLCIPSEAERVDDLNGAITKYRANYVHLTPSVASLLEPSSLATLQNLNLGGERLTMSNIPALSGNQKLLVSYGPAECSISCSITPIDLSCGYQAELGKTKGSNSWIVEATQSGDHLVPVGAVGELWLEGPIVGRGYLNSERQTKAAFVHNPPWLLAGGRSGRLYKTGDLVRYDPDGSLVFVGRKDDQVKVRGQRVEVSEVERHIRDALAQAQPPVAVSVVVDFVTVRAINRTILIAFLSIQDSALVDEAAHEAAAHKLPSLLESPLAARMPPYMIPAAYIAIKKFGMTSGGKIDRRKLREIAASLSVEQLNALTSLESKREVQAPTNETEERMRLLWSRTLDKPPEEISIFDNFFRIGGDSIQAMRLAGASRGHGIRLNVAEILRNPRLCDLAKLAKEDVETAKDEEVAPFSLLEAPVNIADIKAQVALACGAPAEHVEDTFPCTPLQEGLLALTSRDSGNYVACIVRELRSDVKTFMQAWDWVVANTPILRTRIVNLPYQGLVQAVLRRSGHWRHGEDLQEVKRELEEQPMNVGTALSTYGIATDTKLGTSHFVWRVHHALYDGWTMSLIMEALEQVSSGVKPPRMLPFQNFVKHVRNVDSAMAARFWTHEFAEMQATPFPTLPSSANYRVRPDATMSHNIQNFRQHYKGEFPVSVAIQAAWAALIAAYGDTDEALFGMTLTGRNAPVEGVDKIAGPAIATVPVRLAVNKTDTIHQMLQKVHDRSVRTIPFEQGGLQNIRKIGPEAQLACEFQTLLVIEFAQSDKGEVGARTNSIFADQRVKTKSEDVEQSSRSWSFYTYALTIECNPIDNDLKLEFVFDSKVIDRVQVRRLAAQFEGILRQLCDSSAGVQHVQDVELASDGDVSTIWDWNSEVPPTVNRTVHEMITETASKQGKETLAVDAADGTFTYHELDDLSTRLAHTLFERSVEAEIIVPLFFEKSKWMPVAMLAVMKAGGGSLAVDCVAQPEERLRSIASQVNPMVCISSAAQEQNARNICGCAVLVIGDENPPSSHPETIRSLPAVAPENTVCIVFTSGSTGEPKGIVLTHQNLASSVAEHRAAFGIRPGSRIFDFPSYSFDHPWSSFSLTFTTGAVLCIPSDFERINDTAVSLQRFKPTFAFFTTSLLCSLPPSCLSTLETVAFGGERLHGADIPKLEPNCRIVQVYGPAECTVYATVGTFNRNGPPSIGTGAGSNTWVVRDTGSLAPIGAIGELYLEGPLVGRGYHNKPEQTAAAFVSNPPWLVRGVSDRPGSGRCGRLYRTNDLVRYTSNGELLFVGRNDDQVKIRGQRVELGEVEQHVRKALHDLVSEIDSSNELCDQASDFHVVAEVVKLPNRAEPILVAFVHAGSTSEEDLPTNSLAVRRLVPELEARLVAILPAYLVPGCFVPLQEPPPRTVTGKINRRVLRRDGAALALKEMELRAEKCVKRAPSTITETKLQSIWAHVLNLTGKIGIDEDFFTMGDSISAMQVSAMSRADGLNVTVKDILEHRTIERLASNCTAIEPGPDMSESCADLEGQSSSPPFALTPIQSFHLDRNWEGDSCFDQFFLLEITQPADASRVQQALHTLVERHPMLRARFHQEDGAWVQRITDLTYESFHFNAVSSSHTDLASAITQTRELLDIRHGPLVSGLLVTQPHKQLLFLTVQHLVVDLVSWRVLLKELEDLLLSRSLQPSRSTSFYKWATLQQEYAIDHLEPEVAFPKEVRQPLLSYWGLSDDAVGRAKFLHEEITLDASSTSSLLTHGPKSFGARPLELMIAALVVSFSRVFTDRELPVVFNEGHGRESLNSLMDISETVGWFTTMFPIQMEQQEVQNIEQAVQACKTCFQELPRNGWSYFASRYLNPRGRRALQCDSFEVNFNYLGVFQQVEREASLFRRLDIPAEMRMNSKRPLRAFSVFDVVASVDNGVLAFDFKFDPRAKHQEAIARWAEVFRQVLLEICARCQNSSSSG